MSTSPTPTTPFTLAAEVEYLLQTKDDYLASSRSSAALSALKMHYEELESSWKELTMPSEEQQLQYALLSLEQKKADWKASFARNKEELQQSKKKLVTLLQQQKLTLPQLVEQLMQKYNGEWESNARSIEQQQQHLSQKKENWPGKKKALVHSYLDVLTTHQQTLEQKGKQRQQNLTDRKEKLEQLRQSYEGSTKSTMTFAEKRLQLNLRRQALQERKQQLALILKERNEQELFKNRLLAKQKTDTQQLTNWSLRLESENEHLMQRRTRLIQAGWLSEHELPPVDLSPILANLPSIEAVRS